MPTKFQHTRALLVNIAQDNEGCKPDVLVVPGSDGDEGGDAERATVSGTVVSQVSRLLHDENEDALKDLLKDSFGVPDDEDVLEHYVMDLMHKHNDDISGVPFTFLTPRKPISRPSSRASSTSSRLMPNRPDTPNSQVSSPLAYAFRRPHTPVMSPLAAGSHLSATSYLSARAPDGPNGSPPQLNAQAAASLPASPLASPRVLNAKAAEFKPGGGAGGTPGAALPRPLSAASNRSALSRKDTASPDLWSSGISRSTSNLAIAAPLLPDTTLLSTSWSSTNGTSTAPLPRRPQDADPEDDEFSPFATQPAVRTSFHESENGGVWSGSSNSTGSQSTSYDPTSDPDAPYNPYAAYVGPEEEYQQDQQGPFGDGMTPLDVLSSVFGNTVAPEELEDALARNGYDFDTTMAWLIDRRYPQLDQAQHRAIRPAHGGVFVVPRDNPHVNMIRGKSFESPVRTPGAGKGPGLPGKQGGLSGPPNRVCRYFLAGECLRADCKFSHDIERAMCRFWLRGTCAKQENCEFLHHLPEQWDSSVKDTTTQMTATELDAPSPAGTPVDEFPTLSHEPVARGRRGGAATRGQDPSRARFALAVKKAAQQSPANLPPPTLGAHFAATPRPASTGPMLRTGPPVARASPRIRLRPPTLLPTLSTGAALNEMYLAYRARAIKLGAERHSCLSRAAEAWRRGDGAAAKQYSLQGAELNAKMGKESAEAVARLMRERSRLSVDAVRSRETSWSDDPRDRTERGKLMGGNLGVCLGVAAKSVDTKATPEERMEVVLDLHGLHATEATEVLETFLLSLESEHYFGLAYLVVGEEKHTGTQDPLRGASRLRLAAGVRDWLHKWGYPWSERDGIICADPLTHQS
ncbi:hypothetical protein AURDEDRAFT_144350 [Auricularia subglabra TFB-10046 SS5]|nr:hypothetical protein AURDEDRAFT_144350 [Auricularia subglabra TFB-10046 SS5]